MLTQTAITQLSTGSVAVVCQYTDVDTNSRHSVTAAAGLSSQLSNRTKPNQTKPNQTKPNPANSCTVTLKSGRRAENEEYLCENFIKICVEEVL